jgi:hypothetical protein
MADKTGTSDGQAAVPPVPVSDGTGAAESTPFPSLARARAAASVGSAQTPLPAPPTGPSASAAQLAPPAAQPVAPAPVATVGAPTAAAAPVVTLPQLPAVPQVALPPLTGLRGHWYAHPFWRALAIIAALAIAGLLFWLLLLRDTTPNVEPSGAPVILTRAELATFSGDIGQPIYWVGPTAGARLEVTETPITSKPILVRYLTDAAPAGDPSTRFLTIGTYPTISAYWELRTWAHQHNAPTSRVPGGGIAVSVPGSPTSVFYAKPTQDAQVELYDPDPGQALHLVRSGAVRPVAPAVQVLTPGQ